MKYSVVMDHYSFDEKWVKMPASVIDNFDFIKGTSHYYFYQPRTQLDAIVIEQIERLFDGWRQTVLHDDTFQWDQMCKFPYLRKSLAEEKELRFPLIFFNDVLLCGAGRYFTVMTFFPDMPMDAVRIYDYDLYQKPCPTIIDLNMILLTDMDQYQSILMETRKYIREMAAKDYWLNFHINNDIIMSADVSPTPEWKFPFVGDPPKDVDLIRKIKQIISEILDRYSKSRSK